MLRGDPGIGKTALLQAGVGYAQHAGIRVLSAAGYETEARVAHAGLHQLFGPGVQRSEQARAASSQRNGSSWSPATRPGGDPVPAPAGALGIIGMATPEELREARAALAQAYLQPGQRRLWSLGMAGTRPDEHAADLETIARTIHARGATPAGRDRPAASGRAEPAVGRCDPAGE